MDRPTISQMVIDEFANIIDSQDEKGFLKYGKTLDHANDSDYSWELMALEETADLQKYLVKEIKRLKRELHDAKAKNRYKNFIAIAEENLKLANENFELKQELDTLKKAYDALKISIPVVKPLYMDLDD